MACSRRLGGLAALLTVTVSLGCGSNDDATPSRASGGTGGSGGHAQGGSGGSAVGGSGGSDAGGAGGSDSGAPPASIFEDTYDGIHPFLTFDYKVTDVASAAEHAVYVWGNEENHIPAYRASSNPKIVLSKYIPYTRDPESGHDLAYWQNLHPDWVLYQCDQTTPAYEFGDTNVPLDITNPAVVAFQLDVAKQASDAGYDAIAADNFTLSNEFGACGIFVAGNWKQLYTGKDDPKYTTDVLVWLHAFSSGLHALPKRMALIPNFSIGSLSANDPNVLAVLAEVDGILDEGGFTDYGSGYVSGDKWTNLHDFIEQIQAAGKAYFSINEYETSLDTAAVQWALASYLMSKQHASGLFVSGVQQYGSDNWQPEYAAQVGPPCGAMQATQSMFLREYRHAIVIVNANANDGGSFTLPSGTFIDLYGKAVQDSVSLGAHEGIVLLDSGGPRC